jgi:hypothetical protein
MVSIIANEAIQAAIAGLSQRTEIRGPDGRILGYFEPTDEVLAMYEQARKHIDPEEIKRIKSVKDPGISTKELLEYLRSLAPEQ